MTVPEREAPQLPVIIGFINHSKKHRIIKIHKCNRLPKNFTKM